MGMMCNIGELETAVRENIPVVCVVFNDEGLGNERAFQNELYGGRLYAVDYGDVDFGALARVLRRPRRARQGASGLLPALKRRWRAAVPRSWTWSIDPDFHAAVVFK